MVTTNSKAFVGSCKFGIKCNAVSCFFPCQNCPYVEASASTSEVHLTSKLLFEHTPVTDLTIFTESINISPTVNMSNFTNTVDSN